MNPRRTFGATQGLIGVFLVMRPQGVSRKISRGQSTVPTWLARLLGARLLGQGCWLMATDSDESLVIGYIVEAVHGSTMVTAAIVAPRYRRSALAAAGLAAALFVAGIASRG
jgi:hypothetical protein